MASSTLLALIDDIAAVLDDIAVLSKVAAKKAAGVLGDDLALNAQQVAGVKADRELPVVWAVAKGSARNKLILVPAALLISALMPWAITPLLMMGGAYLCYEGFEKIYHALTDSADHKAQEREALTQALLKSAEELVLYEENKIKGAIRTDFILSAEIIVIALGIVQGASFITQVSVVSLIAAAMTIGVYSLVAGIVKLDDAGLYLIQKPEDSKFYGLSQLVGTALLKLAPRLMKTLGIVGTIAMFLVGGGILAHGIPGLENYLHHAIDSLAFEGYLKSTVDTVLPTLANFVLGILAGGLVMLVVAPLRKLKAKFSQEE